MPIKGLSDRGVAFPQIGNIRKGAKKVDANRPGADLPHFRIEFDERETKAIAKFNQLYQDGKPTALTIILPFDQIERVWNPWREAYSAGTMLHRCDGEFVNYAIDQKTGEVLVKNGLDASGQPVKCTLQNDPDKRKRCKPTGRLHVIIPELERLAYLVVHTTSIHDIANISDQLAAIQEMNGGHIVGIPLILRRRPVKISTPSGENGKRQRMVKYLISIEADPEWVSRKIGALRIAAMPTLQQITAPVDNGQSLEALAEHDSGYEPDEDEISDEPIIDGEVTSATEPEPERPSYRMAQVKFNGMTPDQWHARCHDFAADNDNWQKDGRPDMNNILASAGHAGYQTITSENVERMFIDIVAAHAAKVSEAQAAA